MSNNDQEKTGVILVNLGTPDKPAEEEVKTYLQEFLSDKDVIRLPRVIWFPILHFIILNIRPKKSAALYKKVWTKEGSPLLYNTNLQTHLLQKNFDKEYKNRFLVETAMRYGNPSIEEKLLYFKRENCKTIIVLPLFPQYSTTTTRSVARKIFEIMQNNPDLANTVNIKIIKEFYNRSTYINALAKKIENYQKNNGKPDKILFSFHGIPKSYINSDEPYEEQCNETTRLLAKRLNLEKSSFEIVFQSRFGLSKWLQPYLSERIKTLPKEGIKSIQIFCPGFVSDCLETLEEICVETKELFLKNKGTKFGFIPCLNNDEVFISSIAEIVIDGDKNYYRSKDFI